MALRKSLLIGIQAFVGVAAVVGGALLAAAPDGRLLAADPSLLRSTPFADYFMPGLLLGAVVGIGGLGGAALTVRAAQLARLYTALYATGVIAFEGVEYALIGWQPLQAVVAVLGVAMLAVVLSGSVGALRRQTPLGRA